jgi:hypothetical protein
MQRALLYLHPFDHRQLLLERVTHSSVVIEIRPATAVTGNRLCKLYRNVTAGL